jgi:uncharacterized protein YjdB
MQSVTGLGTAVCAVNVTDSTFKNISCFSVL